MSKFTLEYDNVSGHAILTVVGANAPLQDHNWKRWLVHLEWFINHASPHGCDFEGWEVLDGNKLLIKYKPRPAFVKADM